MPTCCTDLEFERSISRNTSTLILAYVSFFCSMLRVLHRTGVILLGLTSTYLPLRCHRRDCFLC
jgi:hypothetical protein